MQCINFEHSTARPSMPKTIGHNLMENLWTLGRKRCVRGGSYLESLDEKSGSCHSFYYFGITAGNNDNFQ